MKIAIYHNLDPGGALNYLIETTKCFHNKNIVDIYSFKNNVPKHICNNLFLFHLSKTNNIFDHIYQVLFELKDKNYQIAKTILKNNYDLVIVHPCLLTQAPYILQWLDLDKTVYIFHEPKREFYENTHYNFFNPKQLAAYVLRYFIKFIDQANCKKAKIIISNSHYSNFILNKIYQKKSFIIHPGEKPIQPQKIHIKNNHKIISSGVFNKTKGHDFTINQIKNIYNTLPIIGNSTNEYKYISSLSNKIGINILLIKAKTNNFIQNILKKYSIYLSNPNNEPFGIATLEATENNLFVLGKNQGGTSEIVQNGLNGLLYPNDILIAQKTLKSIYNKKYFTIYKTSKINWDYSASRILDVYHHLTHTPNE